MAAKRVRFHEPPLTNAYWQRVGGTLIPEFRAVEQVPGVSSRRSLDGVILVNRETRVGHWQERPSLDGEDVIVVQTKATRLNWYLMGQAVLSSSLIRQRWRPASLRSALICTAEDPDLRPLVSPFPDVTVEIMESKHRGSMTLRRMPGAVERYWRQRGGTLIRNYELVPRCRAPLRAEAVLLLDGPGEETAEPRPLTGRDVLILQSYDSAPGMYISGEAIFTAALAQLQQPKTLHSIILCKRDDRVIRAALEAFPEVKIVIDR